MRSTVRWWQEHGLSMAEAVVGMAILTLVLTPLLGLFTSARWAAADAGNKTEALTLAREVLDEAAAGDWDTLGGPGLSPGGSSTTTTTFGPYTVTVEVTRRSGAGGDSWKNFIKDVVVTVSWDQRGSTASVELATALEKRK